METLEKKEGNEKNLREDMVGKSERGSTVTAFVMPPL